MFADVRLDVGTPLMARITTKTLAELDLKPGQKVFALVRMWECRRQPWSGMSVVPGGGFGRAAGKKCRCG
jgi:hypothetical protein